MERDWPTPGGCDACGRSVDGDQDLCDDCDATMYTAYMEEQEQTDAEQEQAA